jgi:hypothetical protein
VIVNYATSVLCCGVHADVDVVRIRNCEYRGVFRETKFNDLFAHNLLAILYIG